jgi:carbon storage regulator
MLVLNRKTNESIIIGEDIVVTILEVNGRRVQVGIAAPAHVSIRRQELQPAPRKLPVAGIPTLQNASDPSTR